MADELSAALDLPDPALVALVARAARVAFPHQDEAAEDSALAMLRVLQERQREA